ncbi:uncharacterized [Tachysurus ichikawai]
MPGGWTLHCNTVRGVLTFSPGLGQAILLLGLERTSQPGKLKAFLSLPSHQGLFNNYHNKVNNRPPAHGPLWASLPQRFDELGPSGQPAAPEVLSRPLQWLRHGLEEADRKGAVPPSFRGFSSPNGRQARKINTGVVGVFRKRAAEGMTHSDLMQPVNLILSQTSWVGT